MIGKKLFSLVRADGTLVLYLDDVDTGVPGPDDVIVRIDATPINPSDLLVLLAFVDPGTLQVSGSLDRPLVTGVISSERLQDLAGRIESPQAVGNEGAGLVVAAGENAAHLVGKTVALIGRAMFAEYIRVPAGICRVLPDGIGAIDGAASLINPLTALGMIETMRTEGHSALVHTAAASSLGQMLNRICIEDGIPLINIVRRKEQACLLRDQGAQHVCVSSEENFSAELADALEATRATIAFDAIGGGLLIGQLLDGMEAVALRNLSHYGRYGSMTQKRVYVYGALDDRPIQFQRRFDFSWSVSGWLLTPFLEKLSQNRLATLWSRIATHLDTTFASSYTALLSLEDALQPSNLKQCAQQATGRKFLITPHKLML